MVEASSSQRNPPWSRDELILALDFYLRHRNHIPGKTSSEIEELSMLLNDMARQTGRGRETTYRNLNGVYMKLMNFRRFDPDYTKEGKVGLQRGNRMEEELWSHYAGDVALLRSLSQAIRTTVQGGELQGDLPSLEGGDEEAVEGRVLTALHTRRERNRRLVGKKKSQVQKRDGQLKCEACGFDFEETYGDRGRGFIECHHVKPLHLLAEAQTTRLDDLALLCSNCHRMVHARRPWLTVDDLRSTLSRRHDQR